MNIIQKYTSIIIITLLSFETTAYACIHVKCVRCIQHAAVVCWQKAYREAWSDQDDTVINICKLVYPNHDRIDEEGVCLD